ncbi:hypothetical protein ACQKP0_25090 [Heyndrickxia sp. NPDC080065]|uniref:hypothetical protein n=1 Tax=Heyndrickxia sp. NPDC080065 TaxID=3390568 RepID=UPI003D070324
MKTKMSVIYDYEPEGRQRNMWFVIDFMEPIPWMEKTMYIKVSPCDYKDVYEFQDDIIGCTILLEELIITHRGPEYLGFNLQAIHDRLCRVGMDPVQMERFIIQAVDVKEVLTIAQINFVD